MKSVWILHLLAFILNYEIGFGQYLAPSDFGSSLDGAFESLSGVANNDVYNSNIYARGWSPTPFSPSIPDSWVSPMPFMGSGLGAGLADGMPSSTDGGVFVGGWTNSSNNGEALTARITDLTIRVDNDVTGFNYDYITLNGVRLFPYEDTDEDGIPNFEDMDDDNDGILDEVECPVMEILSAQNADGTFESLTNVANSNVPNGIVGVSLFVGLTTPGSGWAQGNGSPDSWMAPVALNGSGSFDGTADGMPPSPDGGVFIGAQVRGTNGESFFVRLDDLDIGRTYVLKFYQANAGIDGLTPIDPAQKARWRIGNLAPSIEDYFSTPMDYMGEGNQIWMEEEVIFTATSATKWLTFQADSDGTGFVHEYMAIDGIRLYAQRLAGDVSDCSLDTDGDGLMDYVDVDSDGDNCPDALEGNGTFTKNNLDTNNRLAGAVDTTPLSPTYGVPLVAVGGQGVGSSKDNTVRLGCPTTVVTNRGITFRVKRD